MTDLLVVEDDPDLRTALGIALRARGYAVRTAGSVAAARRELERAAPDLAVVDLGLPDGDGLDVVRGLAVGSRCPVIVLSARADRYDKIRALDNGADDYVTKPFDFEELLARVRAALRRTQPAAGAPVVQTPAFTIDLDRKTVVRSDGRPVRLTPTEWAFIEVLSTSPGKAVGSAEILRRAWGPGYEKHSNYLRVYSGQLRKKLEPDPAHPRYIITIPGVGYRLDADDPTDGPSGPPTAAG